jgi:hypothetical protein
MDENETIMFLELASATQALFDGDDDEEIAIQYQLNVYRDAALFRKRWDSQYLINLAEHEGSFVSEYRIDPGGFDVLVNLVQEVMPCDKKMALVKAAESQSDPISIDSKVGAALILLGGGRVMESMRTHGMSMSYVYDNFHNVVRAINKHPALAITSGNTTQYCKCKADAIMKQRSSYGIFKYCCGCIDGIALSCDTPHRKKYKNQSRFFSGSKKKICVNVQAVCDGDYTFQAMTAKHVGSTNDADAFESCSLKCLNQSLPFPYHWNGDAAYTLTEWMMIPFPGVNLHILNRAYDSFNFWQSQVRILIEQSFGMFIQIFGIFWKSSRFDLDFFLEIIHCCFRLYNFIRRRRIPCVATARVPPPHAALDANGRLVDDRWRRDIVPVDLTSDIRCGNTLRDSIVEEIIENNYFHVRSHTAH